MKKLKGDLVPIVITQGAIRVSEAIVERDYGDCLLVIVNLHSKYAIFHTESYGKDHGPIIYLGASINSLNLDENFDIDHMTSIEFNDLKGWRVFSISEPCRYSLMITLIKDE